MWKKVDSALLNNTQRKFWYSFSQKAEVEIPFMEGASIRKTDALQKTAGKSGLAWSIAVNRYESWVELTILLSGEKERSHELFDKLYVHKNEIETKYGGPLLWDKLETRKSCRIKSLPLEGHGMDEVDRWSELQESLIDKISRMEKSFSPYFQIL